jgi:hypothetical protein
MMQSQTTAAPKLIIGMDIHKKSWSVHLRTDLFDHKGFSMPPSAEKLADYEPPIFPITKCPLLTKPAAVAFLRPVIF